MTGGTSLIPLYCQPAIIGSDCKKLHIFDSTWFNETSYVMPKCGKYLRNQRGTADSVWPRPVIIQTLPWKQKWVDLASRASILGLLWVDDEENLSVCWNQTRQRVRRCERVWEASVTPAYFCRSVCSRNTTFMQFTCKKLRIRLIIIAVQWDTCSSKVHDAFQRHYFFQGAKWFSLIVGKSLTLIFCMIEKLWLRCDNSDPETAKRSLTQAFSQIRQKGWIIRQAVIWE